MCSHHRPCLSFPSPGTCRFTFSANDGGSCLAGWRWVWISEWWGLTALKAVLCLAPPSALLPYLLEVTSSWDSWEILFNKSDCFLALPTIGLEFCFLGFAGTSSSSSAFHCLKVYCSYLLCSFIFHVAIICLLKNTYTGILISEGVKEIGVQYITL